MKKLLLAFLASGILFSCSKTEKDKQEKPMAKKPNILFIMTDDHGLQAISAYQGLYKDVAPTPNIDRIAHEGAIFTNAFCTNSICGPSRASIITGKYSHLNKYYKNEGNGPYSHFDADQITLPKILKDNGYQTAMVGKWHLHSVPQGFDYYNYHIAVDGQGYYWNPVYNQNGDTVQAKGYSTNLTTNYGLDWLKQQKGEEPFALFLQYKAPHRPWRPDSVYQHLFDGVEIPYPKTFDDDYASRELTAGKQMMEVGTYLNRQDLKLTPPEGLTPMERNVWLRTGDKGEYFSPSDTLEGEALKRWKYQRWIKDYLAVVRSVDDNIGKVLKYLDDNELTENTIVVYTSDQGFYLGDHGWFDKRFMYEPSLHMPLIVRYPKVVKAGQQIDKMVLNVDFAPSLLQAAGIEPDESMQGNDFFTLFEGENVPWRKAMYYHYYEYPKWHNVQPHYGVRTDRYKLIHYYYNIDVWELFDLQNDPDELHNIYDDPDNEELIQTLKIKMAELQKQYGDTSSVEDMKKITSDAMLTY